MRHWRHGHDRQPVHTAPGLAQHREHSRRSAATSRGSVEGGWWSHSVYYPLHLNRIPESGGARLCRGWRGGLTAGRVRAIRAAEACSCDVAERPYPVSSPLPACSHRLAVLGLSLLESDSRSPPTAGTNRSVMIDRPPATAVVLTVLDRWVEVNALGSPIASEMRITTEFS